jgi:hypothetical protein
MWTLAASGFAPASDVQPRHRGRLSSHGSILIRCTGGTDIPTDALAGWLERQRPRIEHEVVVAEILGDMRLLGLRPAALVPYALATVESPDVEAGSYATPVQAGST